MSEKTARMQGVAKTVGGLGLSRLVTPEPMTECTKALMAFLQSGFDLVMARLEPARC